MKFGMKFNNGQNKDYQLILQRRKKLFVAVIAMGVLISGLSFFFLGSESHTASYTRGFGVGLIFVGALMSFKNWQMLKNKEKMEKNKREELDERNIAINNQALITALRIFIVLLVLVTVVTAFFNPVYSSLTAAMLSTYLVLYLISYIYYQKKM
ncbi:DUF6442 family protein [Enterococcus sp. BWR-S5]|uniref:DUF6442 family protein n=1 Tax=Enterococcus sp. BWR-S5 TaxID=2787714 RepID=UPI001924C4D0|nr:DUF6442 family protein [Enterococcus sp. BWR-S5]MBL1227501.1 hypothetical protein [Enterococcus sp. BWR-S5]